MEVHHHTISFYRERENSTGVHFQLLLRYLFHPLGNRALGNSTRALVRPPRANHPLLGLVFGTHGQVRLSEVDRGLLPSLLLHPSNLVADDLSPVGSVGVGLDDGDAGVVEYEYGLTRRREKWHRTSK